MAFKNSLKSSTSPSSSSIIGMMYLFPDCLSVCCFANSCVWDAHLPCQLVLGDLFLHQPYFYPPSEFSEITYSVIFNFHSPSFSVIRYILLYQCYKITYSVIVFRDIMAFVLLVHFDYSAIFSHCQYNIAKYTHYFQGGYYA